MGIFDGILGNEPALRLLESALASGEVAHAYLFYGSPGVGKRTVARRFGAALVSGGDEGAEDRALRGLHPDLSEIEPEGRHTTIGQIREVVRLGASRPFEGTRQAFVLRADTLNVQAANALLKTLEEPEGEAVFILLAASREGVLPTVVSRAQGVRFDPVPQSDIVAFLLKRGHPEEEARLAAALGRGSVGLALRYAEEDEFKELREAIFGAAFSFTGFLEDRYRAVEEIMARAEDVGVARERAYLTPYSVDGELDRWARNAAKRAGRAAQNGAVAEALELLALLYRDIAVVAAGTPELVANADRLAEFEALAAERPGTDWAGAARIFGEAKAKLTYNVSPESILEVALSQTRHKILGISPGS
jgi:DNA polymerase-3 subunit delta'